MNTITAKPFRAAGDKAAAVLRDLRRSRVLWGCLGAFGGGLLLADLPLGSQSLPLGACLCLGVPFFPYAIPAALGAGIGYFWAFPWDLALESFAVTVLVFIGAAVFHGTALSPALLSGSLTAAIGAVFLLDSGVTALSLSLFLTRVLLGACAPVLFRRAIVEKHSTAVLVSRCLVLTALARFLPPVGRYAALGLSCFVSAATAEQSVLPTLLCGAAMDLAGTGWVSLTACLGLGAWGVRLLPGQRPLARLALLPGVCMLWQLFFGVPQLSFLLVSLVGTALGLLCPLPRQPEKLKSEPAAPDDGPRLRRLSRIFLDLRRDLLAEEADPGEADLAELYDNAADRVCRCCVHHDRCWQNRDTLEDLTQAAERFVPRGSALREDFPDRFSGRCIHMEGFLTAVNQELEQQLSRRQSRNRLDETRRVVAEQYLFLSGCLDRLSRQPPESSGPLRYKPELAVRTAAVPGCPVCGDRGSALTDRQGQYYVLLCDGMGTGTPARQESDRAVRTLTALLEVGSDPAAAMGVLNGFYVLRRDAAFSTVDLLQADLRTGEAVLYKWGAAPSFYRSAAGTEKIGTASPPPGVRAEARPPEQYRLSLKEGETLVMVSDGALGEETEDRVRSFPGGSVRDLAACVLSGAGQDSRDDVTAIVLRLRRDLD